jgi:hypothetical protein
MEIVVSLLAIIGLACVLKHFMHAKKEGCMLCDWTKVKEDVKKAGEKASHMKEEVQQAAEKASHKIKVEDEKQQGTRYGSNPINY